MSTFYNRQLIHNIAPALTPMSSHYCGRGDEPTFNLCSKVPLMDCYLLFKLDQYLFGIQSNTIGACLDLL